jgi:drug/metabolite transporter (DMT)-like permease
MGLPPLTVTTGQMTAAAAIMLPLALVVDHPWAMPVPPASAWAAIAALALVCTAFAYVLYFRLIDGAGATNALLVTLLVPPTAILLGGLFLGEHLAPQDFLGLVLIALGLAAIDGRLFSLLRTSRVGRVV